MLKQHDLPTRQLAGRGRGEGGLFTGAPKISLPFAKVGSADMFV